jgi:hypothetical protein
MQNFAAFVGSVFGHVFTLLAGCVVTVVINLIERHFMKGRKLPPWADIAILLLFLFFACFQAWRDKSGELEKQQVARTTDTDSATNKYDLLKFNFDDLNARCKYQSGVIDTLTTQNRDQQNSINLCQTQAIRRLQPVPDKTVAFPVKSLPGPNAATYIMLTNKTVSPVTIEVTCDSPITDLQGGPINTTIMTYSPAYLVGKNAWSFTIATPPWAPDYPIVISFKYPGPNEPKCDFRRI